jgi:U3 small nucleolar RNA-associated protein 12
MSSDETVIVTGSADKNVKIWGLDFGDCQKSMFAHGDSVMAVQFVPNTHYFFSSGKDGVVKFWDADIRECVMTFNHHHAEVLALAVSRDGETMCRYLNPKP